MSNHNINAMSSRAQAAKILAALLDGEGISSIDALNRWGCFRLGARVYDLRAAGVPITKRLERRNGKGFARYYIAIKDIAAARNLARQTQGAV